VRSPENREQRLGSYALFQRSAPPQHTVWNKMMRGPSTRNYGPVVREVREAYGMEKSAVSDNFSSRPAGRSCRSYWSALWASCGWGAVLIDGTPFRDRQTGAKPYWTCAKAGESASVIGELLNDLAARGSTSACRVCTHLTAARRWPRRCAGCG
jgi:hypothetical protein